MKTTSNILHWGQKRDVTNKFIKKYRNGQAAYHDIGHILVPFTMPAPGILLKSEVDRLQSIIYSKGYRGGIIGSSYGNTSFSLVKIFLRGQTKGFALVQVTVGIGE